MTELFYEKAFGDQTLDTFIRSHDDPHGARFAKWIYQKLSGDRVWDEDRYQRNLEPIIVAGGRTHVVHDRSSAHVAAWYSPKRELQKVGRHFSLDECRVWMRLHFLGLAREWIVGYTLWRLFTCGLLRTLSASTNKRHPRFAWDSLRWSANPSKHCRIREQWTRNEGRLGIDIHPSLGTDSRGGSE